MMVEFAFMLVRKCDKCGIIIPEEDRKTVVKAGIGYDSWEFCEKCGVPVYRFLETNVGITA